MNTSGEAADQVMRMMLNGAEVLIKLSGSGAKNAAVLLYSIARQHKKTKGAARLESMLRSGKPLKVYTFRDSDLPKFKEPYYKQKQFDSDGKYYLRLVSSAPQDFAPVKPNVEDGYICALKGI